MRCDLWGLTSRLLLPLRPNEQRHWEIMLFHSSVVKISSQPFSYSILSHFTETYCLVHVQHFAHIFTQFTATMFTLLSRYLHTICKKDCFHKENIQPQLPGFSPRAPFSICLIPNTHQWALLQDPVGDFRPRPSESRPSLTPNPRLPKPYLPQLVKVCLHF